MQRKLNERQWQKTRGPTRVGDKWWVVERLGHNRSQRTALLSCCCSAQGPIREQQQAGDGLNSARGALTSISSSSSSLCPSDVIPTSDLKAAPQAKASVFGRLAAEVQEKAAFL